MMNNVYSFSSSALPANDVDLSEHHVKLRDCYVSHNPWQTGDVRGPSAEDRKPMWIKYPDKKVVVREDTNRPIGVVNKTYKLTQYDEVESIVSGILRDSPLDRDGMRVETRFSNGGGRMVRDYYFPSHTIDVNRASPTLRADPVTLRVRWQDSVDGTWMRRIQIGAWRLVCTNGMVVGDILGYVFQRHGGPINKSQIRYPILRAAEAFVEDSKMWIKMAETQITWQQIDHCLEEMGLGPNKTKAIEQRVNMYSHNGERGLTVWNLYNAFTDYATHGSGRRISEDTLVANEARRTDDMRETLKHPAFERLYKEAA